MMRWPILFGFVLALILALFGVEKAQADDATAFFCTSEESAVAIASAMDMENGIIVNEEEVDGVAKPYLMDNVCFYLAHEIDIDITRIIGKYGQVEKVLVVEFTSAFVSTRDGVMLYAFIPEKEGSI